MAVKVRTAAASGMVVVAPSPQLMVTAWESSVRVGEGSGEAGGLILVQGLTEKVTAGRRLRP